MDALLISTDTPILYGLWDVSGNPVGSQTRLWIPSTILGMYILLSL